MTIWALSSDLWSCFLEVDYWDRGNSNWPNHIILWTSQTPHSTANKFGTLTNVHANRCLYLVHISTSPHNSQAPKAQKDKRDRRRYGSSFVLTMATIVNRDTVSPMPQTLFLAVLYIALARGVLIPHQNLRKTLSRIGWHPSYNLRAAQLGELNQGLSSIRTFFRLIKRNDSRSCHS